MPDFFFLAQHLLHQCAMDHAGFELRAIPPDKPFLLLAVGLYLPHGRIVATD
jgi:hypothetical protein